MAEATRLGSLVWAACGGLAARLVSVVWEAPAGAWARCIGGRNINRFGGQAVTEKVVQIPAQMNARMYVLMEIQVLP